MSIIDTENAKIIRRPMKVFAGMDFGEALGTSVVFTPYALSSGYNNHYVHDICDFSGPGIPLDGSCVPVESATIYGVQADVIADADGNFSEYFNFTCSGTSILTIIFADAVQLTGGTTVTEIKRKHVLNITEQSTWKVSKISIPYGRPKVVRAYAGRCLYFDQTNTSSLTAVLRANVDLDANIPLSEIEINAAESELDGLDIYNIDISYPIWFTAGYTGEMSDERKFYLSEPIQAADGIATIRGHDASYLLDGGTYPLTSESIINSKADYMLYQDAKKCLSYAGIQYSSEANPDYFDTVLYTQYIIEETTSREMLGAILQTMPYYFRDAGIPLLWRTFNLYSKNYNIAYHTRPIFTAEKKIKNILLDTSVTSSELNADTIEAKNSCKKNKKYKIEFSGYYTGVTVTNATILSVTLSAVRFKCTASGTCTVKGHEVIYDQEQLETQISGYQTIALSSYGEDLDLRENRAQKSWYYIMNHDTAIGDDTRDRIKSKYENWVNKTCEVTYRGDPRIQPRDIAVLSDGTKIDIGEATLTFTGGGLSGNLKGRVVNVD